MRHLSFLIILFSLLGSVEAHAEVRSPVKVVERRIAMGVEARVVLYAPDEASGRAAARAAFARIEEVERAISSWRPSSRNRRMCDQPGEAFELDQDMFRVLARSGEWVKRSDGVFDPTIGALTELWREARQTQVMPSPEAIDEARRRCGWSNLRLGLGKRTCRVDLAGMRLDFGGIGKGYAAGQALEVLRSEGMPTAMVDIGGDLVVGDPPPEQEGWSIRLQTVLEDGQAEVRLANGAIATSGDVEQFVEFDGERYSHILDPRTGLGLRTRVQVTAIVRGGTMPGADADALASAASLLVGDQSSINGLLSGIPGAELRIVQVGESGFTVARYGPSPTGVVASGGRLKEVFADGTFTEGPATDDRGRVFFTDQPNDRIMVVELDGTVRTHLSPSGRANGLAFDEHGALWACADEHNQLWKIAADGTHEVVSGQYDGAPFNGPNDLWMIPGGGVYFTDPFYRRDYWTNPERRQPIEAVYRLGPEGSLERVAEEFVRPNGIIASPDGRSLYVSDIGAGRTWIFPIHDDGSLGERRLFCGAGSDGMTVDDAGNVYLTGRGVMVFDPDGLLIEHIPIPEGWTSNVCLGGRERRDLFITAMGRVYRVPVGGRGVWSP